MLFVSVAQCEVTETGVAAESHGCLCLPLFASVCIKLLGGKPLGFTTPHLSQHPFYS